MSNIDRLKEWCNNNPNYVGKGCCTDCKHLVDPAKYGGCSGPSWNRDELCEPGYEQYKI